MPDRGDWGAPRGSEVSELFSELEILISNQYFDKNLEYEDMVFWKCLLSQRLFYIGALYAIMVRYYVFSSTMQVNI